MPTFRPMYRWILGITLLCLGALQTLIAQTMVIYGKDGQRWEYTVAQIDSVIFRPGNLISSSALSSSALNSSSSTLSSSSLISSSSALSSSQQIPTDSLRTDTIPLEGWRIHNVFVGEKLVSEHARLVKVYAEIRGPGIDSLLRYELKWQSGNAQWQGQIYSPISQNGPWNIKIEALTSPQSAFAWDSTRLNASESNVHKMYIATFDSSLQFKDPRDQRIYRTVQVGNQKWFAENINIGTKIGGATTPNKAIIEKYCLSNADSTCSRAGGLYTWTEATQESGGSSTVPSGIQGICPPGWHLPSDGEWRQLYRTVGDSTGAAPVGTKLKSKTLWSSGNGTDNFGMTILPAGARNTSGANEMMDTHANYWTSRSYSTNTAYYTGFAATLGNASQYNGYAKTYGFAVRCIQD